MFKSDKHNHTAAPNNGRSFNINWPGIGDKNGNFRPSCITGPKIKKVLVTRRINTAIPAPIAPSLEFLKPKKIKIAAKISTTPIIPTES